MIRVKEKIKPGPKYAALSKENIERAMKNTRSASEAAKYIGVALTTFKRYAVLYKDENGVSLYDKQKNPGGMGCPKGSKNYLKYSVLRDIVTGKISPHKILLKNFKERLIEEGFKDEHCECCGFKEKRAIDGKVPLLLNYRDGDKDNWMIYNLEFLCYNCYFMSIGDVFTEAQLININNRQATNGPGSALHEFELHNSHKYMIEKSTNLQSRYTADKFDHDNIPRELILERPPVDYGKDLICYLEEKIK